MCSNNNTLLQKILKPAAYNFVCTFEKLLRSLHFELLFPFFAR